VALCSIVVVLRATMEKSCTLRRAATRSAKGSRDIFDCVASLERSAAVEAVESEEADFFLRSSSRSSITFHFSHSCFCSSSFRKKRRSSWNSDPSSHKLRWELVCGVACRRGR